MSYLLVRIADNVLEDEDFPVVRLDFDHNHKVISQREVAHGVYSTAGVPCSDLADVVEWLCYDGTGQHPEITREFQTLHGEWRTWPTFEDLATLLRARSILR